MPFPTKAKTEKKYSLPGGPHLRAGLSSRKIIWGTVTLLTPIWVLKALFFGGGVLQVLVVSVSAAVGSEYLFCLAIGKIPRIQDGSSILAAVLLALLFPAQTAWPVVLISSSVGTILGKEVFGGLGQNLFHPALVGYAAICALFPDSGVPALAVQTPHAYGIVSIATAAVGLALVMKKWIYWGTPLFYLTAVAVGALATGESALMLISNNAILLCAFFFAADTVTAPVSRNGRILYSIITGVLTVILYSDGNLTRAVAFSGILANSTVPLLDRFVRARLRWTG